MIQPPFFMPRGKSSSILILPIYHLSRPVDCDEILATVSVDGGDFAPVRSRKLASSEFSIELTAEQMSGEQVCVEATATGAGDILVRIVTFEVES